MQDLVGRTLSGRYRVEQLIGRGGMADVYKVWDEARADHLAMKVLREDLAQDKIFVRRFQREAQTLAKLQHRSIVRFFGLEQEDVLVFLLLEYVEGTSLREQIFRAKGPFSLQQVAEVLRPICAAMHFAHQMGVVHCDLKPGNILINKHGEILVTDFGIARMLDAATSTMVGIGTPAYMAPELIKGEDPTPQTDIYALGVILYEMLSGGERPFTGERAEITGSTAERVRWEQMKAEPKSIQQFNPALDDTTQNIVQRCLAKLPSQRYVDVVDVYDELYRLGADEHTQNSWVEEKTSASSKKVSQIVKDRSKPEKDVQSPVQSLDSLEQDAENKRILPIKNTPPPFLTHVRTQTGKIRDFDLYEDTIVLAIDSKLVIQDLPKGELLKSFNEFGYCTQLLFHSGDRQIIHCGEGDLLVIDVKEERIIRTLKNPYSSRIVKISAIQNMDFCIGLSQYEDIVSWELITGRVAGKYKNPFDATRDVIITPNSQVMKISGYGYIHKLRLPDLQRIQRIKGPGLSTNPYQLYCSRSGRLFVVCDSYSSLQIFHNEALRKIRVIDDRTHAVAFSPDERFVVTIDVQGNISFWNTDTLKKVEYQASGVPGIDKILISEDGPHMVTMCKGEQLDIWECNWDALPREGQH